MLHSLLYNILKSDESFFIYFQEKFRSRGGSWTYDILKLIL
jgi:hypothetical protein